jgi:bifunctional ADP-heptose synthase (sugar kinase/adenylyltransferase)
MKRDVVVAALPRVDSRRVTKLTVRSSDPARNMASRLEKLEEQIQKLSELVRDHAEDMDRLVRIVAENQDVVRLQLLRKHHEKVRVRKHLREANSVVD